MNMENFRKNKLFLLLIILLGIITVLSVVIFIFPASNLEKYEKKLSIIDINIEKEFYRAAEKEIKKASRYIHEYRLWLELLKRSYYISSKTSDYSIYLTISKKAVHDLKGNEECWGFYISALLWNGEIIEASKYLDKLQSEEYDTLKGEILLVLENRKLTQNEHINDSSGLISELNKRRDPLLYEKIGLLSKNEYLLFNSALLWMREGKFDRAHNIIMGLKRTNPSLRASALISYDAGAYTDTINILLTEGIKDQRTYMIIGDSYYYNFIENSDIGNLRNALDYYSRAELKKTSDIIWKIYANLSQIHHMLGEVKKGYQYSLRNIKDFPHNSDVIRNFVENNFDSQPILCKQAIDYYLDKYPEDTQINLLRIRFFPEQMTLAEMNSFLWNLFNSQADEEISRFFMWFLLGNHDYESAHILLSRLENMGKIYKWVNMYQALLLFLERDYDKAGEVMANANYDNPSWYSSYNYSLMNLYLKNISGSLESFLASENALKGDQHIISSKDFDLYIALINAYKSIIYTNMGLYEKADAARKVSESRNYGNPRIDSLIY